MSRDRGLRGSREVHLLRRRLGAQHGKGTVAATSSGEGLSLCLPSTESHSGAAPMNEEAQCQHCQEGSLHSSAGLARGEDDALASGAGTETPAMAPVLAMPVPGGVSRGQESLVRNGLAREADERSDRLRFVLTRTPCPSSLVAPLGANAGPHSSHRSSIRGAAQLSSQLSVSPSSAWTKVTGISQAKIQSQIFSLSSPGAHTLQAS